jgi:predicted nucleic acid-binding protein
MTAAPAVIDTNVVVAGFLTEVSSSPTARILDGMLAGRFRFLLSVELLAEHRDVLLRPKIRRRHRLAQGEVDVLLTEIAANGVALDVESPAGGIGGKGDDYLRRILSVESSALLVTSDLRLMNELRKSVKALTPREFADLVGD